MIVRSLLLVLGAVIISNDIRAQDVTVAYTANPYGSPGAPSRIVGLNMGHLFSVTGVQIKVFSLGVYDYWADGLNTSHVVSIFTNDGSFFGTYTPVPGGSVTIPAGTVAPFTNGYRFQPLPAPITLPPGNYAVIAYGVLNDGFNNDFGDNGFNGFYGNVNGTAAVSSAGSVYDNSLDPGPNFPDSAGWVGISEAAGVNWGCASFTYTVPAYIPTISPPAIIANPGDSATLTAAANGAPPISYQWYFGTPPVPIPGASNSTLVLSSIQTLHSPGNIGNYSVTAQNAYGDPVFSANPFQATVQVIPAETPLKIMPLGDSITYGSEPAAYRADLYQLLLNANFNINYVGSQNYNSVPWLPSPYQEGHSGYRIDQIYDGFLTWINEIPSPDIILLLIGTNDYGQYYYTDTATNRLDQLVQLICTTRPNAKLFVANLTLRTDVTNIETAIETTFNPFVPGIVANHVAMGQHVYFVDLHSALGQSDLRPDNLHPNPSGYSKMAAAWFNAITNVVTPPGSTNATLHVTKTNAAVTYLGVPGFQYVMQRSTNLASGSWVSVSSNTVPTNGVLQVIDGFNDCGGTPPPAAFYKLLMQ